MGWNDFVNWSNQNGIWAIPLMFLITQLILGYGLFGKSRLTLVLSLPVSIAFAFCWVVVKPAMGL